MNKKIIQVGMSNEDIIKIEKESIEKRIQRLNVSKLYIVEKLVSIIDFCSEKVEDYNSYGEPTRKKFRDIDCCLRALEFLNKHLDHYEPKL